MRFRESLHLPEGPDLQPDERLQRSTKTRYRFGRIAVVGVHIHPAICPPADKLGSHIRLEELENEEPQLVRL